jgi:hypothetical protein
MRQNKTKKKTALVLSYSPSRVHGWLSCRQHKIVKSGVQTLAGRYDTIDASRPTRIGDKGPSYVAHVGSIVASKDGLQFLGPALSSSSSSSSSET